MLYYAQTEHPAARIVIKTHPETRGGHRSRHFTQEHCNERISICDAPVSPWTLLDGAVAVYVVSSQMGFETIIAGHKPVVFGQPFYSGWGLSDDRSPLPFPRRRRTLTRAQLFAAAMLVYQCGTIPAGIACADLKMFWRRLKRKHGLGARIAMAGKRKTSDYGNATISNGFSGAIRLCSLLTGLTGPRCTGDGPSSP